MIGPAQLALALARYDLEHGTAVCGRCWRRPAPGGYGMAILTLDRDRWLCDPCLEEPACGPGTAPGRERGTGGGG